jgi:chromosome segregation ATPase
LLWINNSQSDDISKQIEYYKNNIITILDKRAKLKTKLKTLDMKHEKATEKQSQLKEESNVIEYLLSEIAFEKDSILSHISDIEVLKKEYCDKVVSLQKLIEQRKQ